MAEIFSSGAEKNVCPPLKMDTPRALQTRGGRGRGAEYLIETKEILVLASAPIPPMGAFFIRGRNILFGI